MCVSGIAFVSGAASSAFRPVDGAPAAAGNASPQQQQQAATSSLTGAKEAAGTAPVVGSGALGDDDAE